MIGKGWADHWLRMVACLPGFAHAAAGGSRARGDASFVRTSQTTDHCEETLSSEVQLVRLMKGLIVHSIWFLLLSVTLAGCLGDGGEEPQGGSDGNGSGSGSGGALEGQVIDMDLNQLEGAQISLVQDDSLVEETRSGEDGRYRLEDIEPGEYRVQFTAPCCRESVQGVTIVAGDVTEASARLEPYTQAELGEPYIDTGGEWTGFLACGFGAGETVNPCAVDPSSDNVHDWDVEEGVEGVAITVDWDPAGGVLGTGLEVNIENQGCYRVECSHRYEVLDGPPPLQTVINNEDIEDEDWHWDQVEGKRDLQFRVFPSSEPNVVYQQEFTVYWDVFYFQQAPADHDPSPDD